METFDLDQYVAAGVIGQTGSVPAVEPGILPGGTSATSTVDAPIVSSDVIGETGPVPAVASGVSPDAANI